MQEQANDAGNGDLVSIFKIYLGKNISNVSSGSVTIYLGLGRLNPGCSQQLLKSRESLYKNNQCL